VGEDVRSAAAAELAAFAWRRLVGPEKLFATHDPEMGRRTPAVVAYALACAFLQVLQWQCSIGVSSWSIS